MKKEKSTLPPGRPRAFDVDEALGIALDLFRRQGYEGTSLTDLTTAMGINRPSMYAAFGNKEELFRRALQRYCKGAWDYWEGLLAQPRARDAVEKLLLDSAETAEGEQPWGCLLVRGAIACSQDAAAIQEELNNLRVAGEVMLRQRFERAIAEGELPPDTDAAALARYFSTVNHGFSVQVIGGAKAEELRKVAELAMKAWPVQAP